MEYKITNKRSFLSQFKAAFAYKELFWTLVWRNIKVQYSRTYLGLLWVLLQPLILTGIFYLVLNMQLGGATPNYFLFLFSGFILWNLFANSLMSGASCFVHYAGLVEKVYFPRFLLPLTFVASNAFNFLIAWLLLLAGLHFSTVEIHYLYFTGYSLAAVLLLLVVTVGATLLLSVLSIRIRDVQHLLPFIVQVLLFSSPVIYDKSLVFQHPGVAKVLALNPISAALELFRAGVFGQGLSWPPLLGGIGFAFGFLLLGLVVFHRADQSLIDHL